MIFTHDDFCRDSYGRIKANCDLVWAIYLESISNNKKAHIIHRCFKTKAWGYNNAANCTNCGKPPTRIKNLCKLLNR